MLSTSTFYRFVRQNCKPLPPLTPPFNTIGVSLFDNRSSISFPIRRLHTYICTICLYKLMMTMEHKISCKKNDVCVECSKKILKIEKKNKEEEEIWFFCQLFCTWLIFIASPYPLLNDHATFHDLNIILRNKETYFVDIFFFVLIHFLNMWNRYVVLYKPWICYGWWRSGQKKMTLLHL